MNVRLILFFLFFIFFIAPCSAVIMDSTINFDQYVDVPDTTVSYDNYVCDIDNVGSYQIDQDIQASIEVDPSFYSIQVQLVDKNKNQIWVKNTLLSDGKVTITIPGQYTPSTYGLVVLYNGEYKGAKPIVISEYTMTITPDKTSLSPGETLGVNITTNKNGVLADTSGQVKGVLFQGSAKITEVTATRANVGVYRANIDMPTIPGTYYINGIIATNDYVIGYPESVGIAGGGNVNVVSTGSSGFGSGLGSGSSSSVSSGSEEDFENILLREIDRKYTGTNKTVSYNFEKPDNIITHVNFTSLINYGDVDTVVEVLKDTSSLVDSKPPGIVYRHINIWVGKAGWATERTIANASISFKVENQWLNDEGVEKDSICLLRFRDGKWDKLSTIKIHNDSNHTYFRADTPGFSPFVIISDVKEDMEDASINITPIETEGTGIVYDRVHSEEDDMNYFAYLKYILLTLMSISIILIITKKLKII